VEVEGQASRPAERARRILPQNLVLASVVLVVLVTLALFGRIGLTFGVLGHEGSTIVVVLNGLRLLKSEPGITRSGRKAAHRGE
jgi:Cd2+/Zn2+-exporting ATPase